MIPHLLIKLGMIFPRCKQRFWTFTYGKPQKCSYLYDAIIFRLEKTTGVIDQFSTFVRFRTIRILPSRVLLRS